MSVQQVTPLQSHDDGPQEEAMDLADKVLIGEGGNVMNTSAEESQSTNTILSQIIIPSEAENVRHNKGIRSKGMKVETNNFWLSTQCPGSILVRLNWDSRQKVSHCS